MLVLPGPDEELSGGRADMKLQVEPDETARRIRAWLREHPEIAKGKYEAEKGSVEGHCYVASEAYFYANDGEESGLSVYCLSHPGGTHWYLRDGDVWVDLSIPTRYHGRDIPYADGRRRAFIMGYTPSKRAEQVNEALGLWP